MLCSHGTTNTRGAAILFAKDMDLKIVSTKNDIEGRWIISKVQIDNISVMLINCYAPNEDDPQFFQGIIDIVKENLENDICIWGGDFNKCMSENDKLGKFCVTKSFELLNEFIDENEWSDAWRYLHPEIKQFTWFKKHLISGSRLDYFLTPQGNLDLVSDCKIWASYLSDHCLVLLELHLCPNIRGRGSWKMNNSHLLWPDYVEEINDMIRDVEKNLKHLSPGMQWEVLKNNVINFYKRLFETLSKPVKG